MGSAVVLVFSSRAALALNSYNVFPHSSWVIYAGAAVLYSIMAFSKELSKAGPLIFSNRNSRSIRVVIGIHIMFLTALFLLLKVLFSANSSPADWMARNTGQGGTMPDLFLGFAMMLMSWIERRVLYVEAAADVPDRKA